MLPFLFIAAGALFVGSGIKKPKPATVLKKGGEVKKIEPPKPVSKEVEYITIKKRWKKKKESIANLATNIRSLRYNITTDLQSDNDKVFLTALAVELMDKTAERVGNDDSASNGHFGITGLNKKHVTVEGNKVTLKYTGKSGVEHEKVITDERLASNIKKAKEISPNKYLLCTSDNFRIKSDRINRYLSDYDVTAKDLRGFAANKWIVNKLKEIEIADTDKERQKQFNTIAKSVAKKVGHGNATLKKHYMIPELESDFVTKGKIIDIKFSNGGHVLN